MSTPDEYDDNTGPPTLEDDAWFTQFVASLGYPKPKRDPKPANGQMSLGEAFAWKDSIYIDKPGIWNVGPSGNTRMHTFDSAGWYLYDSSVGTWTKLDDSTDLDSDQ